MKLWQSRIAPKEITADYSDVTPERMRQMAWLARISYRDEHAFAIKQAQNPHIIGYQFKDIANSNDKCRIYFNDNEIVVSYCGSDPKNKAHTSRNLNYGRSTPLPFGMPTMTESPFGQPSKVHPGYYKALYEPADAALIDEMMREILYLHSTHPDAKISFTGHSAGGAMAVITAAHLAAHYPTLPRGEIYTFGCPRMGGKHFHARMAEAYPERYFRVEMLGDPVPAWPLYEAEYYVHGGRQVVINHDGKLLPNCRDVKHSVDSFSTFVDGAFDLARIYFNQPAWNSRYSHSTFNYTEALDALCQQDRDSASNIPLDIVHRLRAGEPAENRAYTYFYVVHDQLSKLVGQLDKPAQESTEKLQAFGKAISNPQHFGVAKWYDDCVSLLSEAVQQMHDDRIIDNKRFGQMEMALHDLTSFAMKEMIANGKKSQHAWGMPHQRAEKKPRKLRPQPAATGLNGGNSR